MEPIISVLHCVDHCMERKTMRRLRQVIMAMLAMSGRVTMLGLSRWADRGGSYRTIQRFFDEALNWPLLNWLVIHTHLLDPDDVILLAGDETTVSKAGQKTYGLGRFFSPLAERLVPGLGFFAVSLVSVKNHTSYPVIMKQLVGQDTNKLSPSTAPLTGKRGPGRPPGRRNSNRRDVELSPYLQAVQQMLRHVLSLSECTIRVGYCLLDGAFGNNNALQMVRQCQLHLISKLRYDSVLYLPFTGPQLPRGQKRKYGARIDCRNLPDIALRQQTTQDGVRCAVYQLIVRHKSFADPLNAVIIQRTHKGRQTHVILFSSDLALPYQQIIDYYQLRFQLEFNFRDAKQFWGLEDFMTTKSQSVANSANLAMFLPNIVQAILQTFPQHYRGYSVIDLKAHYRGLKYVRDVLNLLPTSPEPISMEAFFANVLALGSVNVTRTTT